MMLKLKSAVVRKMILMLKLIVYILLENREVECYGTFPDRKVSRIT
jgi:hypothetical protein